MADILVTMTVNTKNPQKLRSILNHHIDYLIDMTENSDIISDIYNVHSYDLASLDNDTKLVILKQLTETWNPDQTENKKRSELTDLLNKLEKQLSD